MDLADVADELYTLPAEEFTAARNAAAKDAANKDDAALVKGFKRPSASAWLVNQLARHKGDRLDQLLELGDELRAAQDALSGDDLRRLNRERHQLVRAVAQEAHEFGPKVTDAVAREIEGTLDAALSDPAAGDAVRTGRLTRALTAGGFDGVDLRDAVALPDAKPAPRTTAATKQAPAAPKKTAAPTAAEKAAAKAAAAKARRELAKARAEADDRQRELAKLDKTVEQARAAVDSARERLDEIEEQLRQARADRAAAEKELEGAQRDRTAAAKAHRDAQARVDRLS